MHAARCSSALTAMATGEICSLVLMPARCAAQQCHSLSRPQTGYARPQGSSDLHQASHVGPLFVLMVAGGLHLALSGWPSSAGICRLANYGRYAVVK